MHDIESGLEVAQFHAIGCKNELEYNIRVSFQAPVTSLFNGSYIEIVKLTQHAETFPAKSFSPPWTVDISAPPLPSGSPSDRAHWAAMKWTNS